MVNSSIAHPDIRTGTVPSPSPRSHPEPETSIAKESWGERLYAALPLFIVGAVCVVIAFELWAPGAVAGWGGSDTVRFRPWILFLALAITGISGGTAAVFTEDSLAAETRDLVSPPLPPPVWDESAIEPIGRTSASESNWDSGWELLEDEVGKPRPFVLVLNQLDEIKESLRKKPGSPPTE